MFGSMRNIRETIFDEGLATIVCRMFLIDPNNLVWVEHYRADPCPVCAGSGKTTGDKSCRACHGRGTRREPATYDAVTFNVRKVREKWLLSEPTWRPMRREDWQELRVEPRQ